MRRVGWSPYDANDALAGKADDRTLWLAVLKQQLDDATLPQRPVGSHDKDEADQLRKEARAWLTTPSDDFAEVCRLAGLDPEQVRSVAIQKIEDAEDHPDETYQRVKPYTHNGLTMTCGQWAAHTGIAYQTLRARLKNGMTFEEAITTTPQKGHTPRTYTIDGVTLTLKEWCDRKRITVPTVYHRLRNGMSLEEALSTPVGQKINRSFNAIKTSKTGPFGFNLRRTMPV